MACFDPGPVNLGVAVFDVDMGKVIACMTLHPVNGMNQIPDQWDRGEHYLSLLKAFTQRDDLKTLFHNPYIEWVGVESQVVMEMSWLKKPKFDGPKKTITKKEKGKTKQKKKKEKPQPRKDRLEDQQQQAKEAHEKWLLNQKIRKCDLAQEQVLLWHFAPHSVSIPPSAYKTIYHLTNDNAAKEKVTQGMWAHMTPDCASWVKKNVEEENWRHLGDCVFMCLYLHQQLKKEGKL